MGWIEDLDQIARANKLRFTFSQHCHSGIAQFVADGHQCGCKRCRVQRGEHWNDLTEAQAALDSAVAQREFKRWLRDAHQRGKDETR